jgi:hypothetical protein
MGSWCGGKRGKKKDSGSWCGGKRGKKKDRGSAAL